MAFGTLGASTGHPADQSGFMDNTAGNYRFLPAGEVFNTGAVPLEGYEIVHAIFNPWVPLRSGYEYIESYLSSVSRPIQALCGMELRIPEQLTPQDFRSFNTPYVEQLREWGLVFGAFSAVSRTNVVPALEPPREPSIHAFSFTAPAAKVSKTFVVSGTADIGPDGSVIAAGRVTVLAMRQKLKYVVGVIGERIGRLGLIWGDATHIDLCHVEDMPGLFGEIVVPDLFGASARGVRVHYARPPIVGSEMELEARGVRREIVINA